MKSILRLTLSCMPYKVMESGEKTHEFRRPSKWIKSRLWNKDGTLKHYDLIRFTNGYLANSPWFECEYKGCFISLLNEQITFSNGLVVDVNEGDVVINCGIITDKWDYQTENKQSFSFFTEEELMDKK